VEAELFHADRQTDRQTAMTKLRVTFSNFATAPKNWVGIWFVCTVVHDILYIWGTRLRTAQWGTQTTSWQQWRTQKFSWGEGGGGQQIQLRTEYRDNGDLGAVAP
jgi:hypothetical protein